MKDQDIATIVISFLLLTPWLVRAAVLAMALWRAIVDRVDRTRPAVPESAEWQRVAD